jgi:hypothetical protein
VLETLPGRVSLLAALVKETVAEARRTQSRYKLMRALEELDTIADALLKAARTAHEERKSREDHAGEG